MRVIHTCRHDQPDLRPVFLAIGTFDGVHLGHQALVLRLVNVAQKMGGQAGVLIPDPHPLAVIDPARRPPLLTPLPRKIGQLGQLGTDWVAVMPFDRERASTSPGEFARAVVTGHFGARYVIVGFNFTFGSGGKGSSKGLCDLGKELGFEVEIHPAVKVGGCAVSSSRIRSVLTQGDVRGASELLGRPFVVEGTVVSGDGRGRRIGIPTANLELDAVLARPGRGVYAVGVVLGGEELAGVANVGLRPTFGTDARDERIEVHILDLNRDIYGETIALSFLERLRDERPFASSHDLVSQVRADIHKARQMALCSGHKM